MRPGDGALQHEVREFDIPSLEDQIIEWFLRTGITIVLSCQIVQ